MSRAAGVAAAAAEVEPEKGQKRQQQDPENEQEQRFLEQPVLGNQNETGPSCCQGEPAPWADQRPPVRENCSHQTCRGQETVIILVGIGAVGTEIGHNEHELAQSGHDQIDPAKDLTVSENGHSSHHQDRNEQPAHGQLLPNWKSIHKRMRSDRHLILLMRTILT